MALKETLQTTNTSLDTILSMAQNLPRAGSGGEDITAETNEYTSLLTEALTEIQGKAALGGNATAEDIREGKTAYVNGQLLEGLMKEGLTGVEIVDVTVSSASYSVTVPHGLNAVPSYVALIPVHSNCFSSNRITTVFASSNAISGTTYRGTVLYNLSAGEAMDSSNAFFPSITSSNVTFKGNSYSSRHYFGTYKMIVIA